MDEEVYVRVFPWRSSEARLSRTADGNSQPIGREGRKRRERGPGGEITAFLLTTGTTRLPPQKESPAHDTALSSLQGTSLLCEICIKALVGHESCCDF